MEPSDSQCRDRYSPGESSVRSPQQPVICVVLGVICSTILVLFTDIEGDVRRWLGQPNDLERMGQVPRRIDT